MPQEIDGTSWRADGEPDEQDQESSSSGKTTSNSAALTAGRASGARVHPAGSAVRGLSWRAAQAGVPGLPHGQGGVRRLYQRDVRPVQAARHDLRPCVPRDAASARSSVRKRKRDPQADTLPLELLGATQAAALELSPLPGPIADTSSMMSQWRIR